MSFLMDLSMWVLINGWIIAGGITLGAPLLAWIYSVDERYRNA